MGYKDNHCPACNERRCICGALEDHEERKENVLTHLAKLRAQVLACAEELKHDDFFCVDEFEGITDAVDKAVKYVENWEMPEEDDSDDE